MPTEVHIPAEVRFLALDSVLDPRQRRSLTVAPGTSVAEIVAAAYPAAVEQRLDIIRVTIGCEVVPREAWGRVRPKPGAEILLRPVPAGDTLRNVLTIAVTVGALALGQIYAPALAGSLGFTSALATNLTSAAITATTPNVGRALRPNLLTGER